MHKQIYILLLYCIYMFQSQLIILRVVVVTKYINSTICGYVQDVMIHNCVNHTQHIIRTLKIKLKSIVKRLKIPYFDCHTVHTLLPRTK